jgi:hypothetical protein
MSLPPEFQQPTVTETPPIMSLPPELTLHIANYLSLDDIFAFVTTNSAYYSLFTPEIIRKIAQTTPLHQLMPYLQLFRYCYDAEAQVQTFKKFLLQVKGWLLGTAKSVEQSLIFLLGYSVPHNDRYQHRLHNFLTSSWVQKSGCCAAILENDAYFEYYWQFDHVNFSDELRITNPLPYLKDGVDASRIAMYNFFVGRSWITL